MRARSVPARPRSKCRKACGLSVSVRKGSLENVERNRDKSLGVTLFVGQRRGNASSSDFSRSAVEQTVRAAYDIARFTAEDPVAGLPEADDLATPQEAARELEPVPSMGARRRRCGRTRAVAARPPRSPPTGRSPTPRVPACRRSNRTSGPATAAASAAAMRARGTRISVAPIAGRGAGMQRDAWYSSMRDAGELSSPEEVGRYAAERALSRLRSRKVQTCEAPVLFESPLVAGLVGSLVQAISGGALYRKASFLVDSLGQPVMAPHLDLDEDPHQPKGKAAHRSTTRACARASAAWSMAAWCRVTSCRATRRASWACAPPGTPAARRTCG